MSHPKRSLALAFVAVASSCGNSTFQPYEQSPERPDAEIPPDVMATKADAGVPEPLRPMEIIGSNSTAQLLYQLTDPKLCESGWTHLRQDRLDEGKGQENWIALQPLWLGTIDRYGDPVGLAEQISATRRVFGDEISTMRISVFWPCFMSNPEMRQEFVDLVGIVQDAGYRVELTLLHHASYPAELHTYPGFGMVGGWAHPNAPEMFAQYAEEVLAEIEPVLAPEAVIYLAIEPVPQLFDGYIHRLGNYPPGGRNAGRSLALALVQMRDALVAAGLRIREEGFTPAIGVNIRPLVGKDAPGSDLLERLHNQWLLDALIEGCVDNNFDGICEDSREGRAIDRLGITFYGTMHASSDDTVWEFGLPGEAAQLLARRAFWSNDLVSNSSYFRIALESVYARFGGLIEDGTLEFGIAEIGFDNGDVSVQGRWLDDYLAVTEEFPAIAFLTIHAPFEHAEFSSGDHYFHLVSRCAPCELTDWGQRFIKTMMIWNRNPP